MSLAIPHTLPQATKPENALILQADWEGGVSHVALDMLDAGIEVTKVILNAADWIYSRRGIPTINYDQPLSEFTAWLRTYITEHKVDCLLIYNQYRPYNQIGWDLAEELDIQCIVLELGLLRPDFCTIYSRKYNLFDYLQSEWQTFQHKEKPNHNIPQPATLPRLGEMRTMTKMKQFAAFFLFSRTMAIFGRRYLHFVDQRRQEVWHHLYSNIVNGLRFQGRVKHTRYNQHFTSFLSQKYYVAPLQVHCDSQITQRSDFSSIEEYIDSVSQSFLKHAPKDTKLIFKVHPMDRGYKDYLKYIKKINANEGGKRRIIYLDRIHLPTALANSLGCITINSTVGLSALSHQKKVICLGEAPYNLENITYQGSLDDFWSSSFSPEKQTVKNFTNLLKHTSQANGTLFQKLFSVKGHTKINWPHTFKHFFSSKD